MLVPINGIDVLFLSAPFFRICWTVARASWHTHITYQLLSSILHYTVYWQVSREKKGHGGTDTPPSRRK